MSVVICFAASVASLPRFRIDSSFMISLTTVFLFLADVIVRKISCFHSGSGEMDAPNHFFLKKRNGHSVSRFRIRKRPPSPANA
jgi:hypothetical protein